MKSLLRRATVLSACGALVFAIMDYLVGHPLSVTLDKWYWYTAGIIGLAAMIYTAPKGHE